MTFYNLHKFELYAAPFLFVVASFLVAQKINRYVNHEDKDIAGIVFRSRPRRVLGHTEYIRYPKGNIEMKIYHPLGLGKTTTYVDIDSDGQVDLILENLSNLRLNKMKNMYIRQTDYLKNPLRFQSADIKFKEFTENLDKDYINP